MIQQFHIGELILKLYLHICEMTKFILLNIICNSKNLDRTQMSIGDQLVKLGNILTVEQYALKRRARKLSLYWCGKISKNILIVKRKKSTNVQKSASKGENKNLYLCLLGQGGDRNGRETFQFYSFICFLIFDPCYILPF